LTEEESRRLKDLPETDGPVLSLDKICKSFGGLSVLFEVELLLFPQEIVGLIGPNGAGKSTLFNVITAIYLPDGGDIFLNGEKVTGRSPHTICHMGVSRTFQLVKVFLSMTALENVLVGATYGHRQKLSRKKAEKVSLECLELVELSEKRDIPAAHLTLSDRRLLEVARALASGPSVTLLDEPMAGLNPSESMKMLQVINRAREEKNVAILWVEHKVDAIFHLCDRVVVLDYGRKIAEGTPEEIAGNSKVIEAYLGASPS
jgi:branched-chain amino acid transport system ATP-binding protein